MNMVFIQFRRYKYLTNNFFYIKVKLSTTADSTLDYLCKQFQINRNEAKYLQLKQPMLKKLSNGNIKNLIDTLKDIGISNNVLITNPSLFGLMPITIKFRFKVLRECGLKMTPEYLSSYFTLMKKAKIGELKRDGHIPDNLNIENRLANYMTQWPTSLTTLINNDVNLLTLFSLRLKIIQRYLELVLDLSNDEFYRGVETYPTVKHRPLETINETLNILQTVIQIPTTKIKSNLYLIHADPDNLKDLIFKFRSIGGIDIKEVIRLHPKIAMSSYSTMLEIQEVLKEFNIPNEAQIRCFDIYTLSPATVRERLEKAKTIPEFATYFNHPRFLKMIHYNKAATSRLMKLYDNNKKCLSLNILSGSYAHYEIFEKAPGDRLGKGKDLIFCVSQALGKKYNSSEIRNALKRHPFWVNIPLVQVKYVCDQLLTEFSIQDIYYNCQIVLYPWKKINKVMKIFNHKNMQNCPYDQIDLDKLTNSQKLSLVLYILEKKHYFIGNGVWMEDRNRNITIGDPVVECESEVAINV